MYRETEIPEFRETARRLAGFFIARLPEDGVPYWDFQAPGLPDAERDASAAAIAASGLLELGRLVPSPEGDAYRSAAHRILTSLADSTYLTRGTDQASVLRHAVGYHPADSEIDVGIIYGDYYFIEALRRYQQARAAG